MKNLAILATAAMLLTLAAASFAQSQSPSGRTVIPPSSQVTTRGHVRTPLYLFIPDAGVKPAIPAGENPASIACIYGVVPLTQGCPKTGTLVPTGGTKAIGVVEYGTYPQVQSDLQTFSTQWGLGGNTNIISLCYPGPSCPNNSGSGWDLEEALDVQYAHAMAPNAQIIVVSFTNDPLADGAETGAAQYIVNNYGAGELSNSYTYNGGEEWCAPPDNCELSYDNNFQQSGIVYFASAGDSGLGPAYPSISPYVVSAGGTGIERDSNGNFTGETCWSGSGGGISQYEGLPQYQLFVENKTGAKRGTPDLAADSSNNSPVAIYSTSYCGGWCEVYGTSVASPTLAGIVNQAGNFHVSTTAELGGAYQNIINPVHYASRLYDVRTGSNGSPAGPGWDQCTGLGTIREPQYF